MQSLVRACRQEQWPAEVVAVVANRADAAGLAWAREQGIATACVPHREFGTRAEFDAALAEQLEAFEPDYVLLAGFMRVLTPEFVSRFEGRLINIHPSLLPAFPGLHTHAQALAVGVQTHGCTVHYVTPVLDDGPILAQGVVPVLANDNADSLAARVLEVEHVVYPRAVRWLVEGRVQRQGQVVRVQGVAQRLCSHPDLGGRPDPNAAEVASGDASLVGAVPAETSGVVNKAQV